MIRDLSDTVKFCYTYRVGHPWIKAPPCLAHVFYYVFLPPVTLLSMGNENTRRKYYCEILKFLPSLFVMWVEKFLSRVCDVARFCGAQGRVNITAATNKNYQLQKITIMYRFIFYWAQ